MPDLTPEKLAELRRLLAEAPPLPYRDSPATHGDPSNGPTYVALEAQWEGRWEEVATGNYEKWCGMGIALAAAAVNALPALLDAAAERDELAAKVERVRAMHRPAYNDAARSPLCPDCAAKAGVHPCGCWADTDYEPVCAVCNEGHKGMSVPWPCPTIRALCGAES